MVCVREKGAAIFLFFPLLYLVSLVTVLLVFAILQAVVRKNYDEIENM